MARTPLKTEDGRVCCILAECVERIHVFSSRGCNDDQLSVTVGGLSYVEHGIIVDEDDSYLVEGTNIIDGC